MTTKPTHPGKITFVDGMTNKVTDEQNAAEVPDDIRFVETSHGLVPTIKVVTFQSETQWYIRLYGPGDELLQTITMLAGQ